MADDRPELILQPSGFQQLLGYRLLDRGEDFAVVGLALEDKHLNRFGVAHGGVLTTLIDTACGLAATWCPFPGRARYVLTLSLSSSFIGQARGGLIRAVGRKKGGGRRVVFCAAEVLDADDRLVAMGEGTFRYREGSEKPDGVPLRSA